MRLEHGVMIAIAIIIGAYIAEKTSPNFENFILTFCTALFLEASTFALNDYYDYEIDKKNKRIDRPLVRGDLSKNSALYLFLIFFPLGILSSFFVNFTCFVIALMTAIFAIFYDAVLKKIKFIGNFFIAYVMAIPFVFGEASVLQTKNFTLSISPAVITVASIAFLSGVGREIMKDVMDFEGDKTAGVKSFPKYLGERVSNFISAVFYLTAILISFLPFFVREYDFYYNNFYYLFLILVTDILLLWTALELIINKNPKLSFHRKLTLFALFLGLLGFLIGAITS
ncbi:MAG: UbiA family prenyltransferase [Candidatus Thermoplasmatota archaeon]|nr:UbiA family prenyltransferase [Candidatus Thermoplasmatota archaeon]